MGSLEGENAVNRPFPVLKSLTPNTEKVDTFTEKLDIFTGKLDICAFLVCRV